MYAQSKVDLYDERCINSMICMNQEQIEKKYARLSELLLLSFNRN